MYDDYVVCIFVCLYLYYMHACLYANVCMYVACVCVCDDACTCTWAIPDGSMLVCLYDFKCTSRYVSSEDACLHACCYTVVNLIN